MTGWSSGSEHTDGAPVHRAQLLLGHEGQAPFRLQTPAPFYDTIHFSRQPGNPIVTEDLTIWANKSNLNYLGQTKRVEQNAARQ